MKKIIVLLIKCLSCCKVNVTAASDKMTETGRSAQGVLKPADKTAQEDGFLKKIKEEKMYGKTKEDTSPASRTNRMSSVIAAGHPHRKSSSDRLFTYLPWPLEPQGSKIIRDKCGIFNLMCSVGLWYC